MQTTLSPLTDNALLVGVIAWVGKMLYETVASELRRHREPPAIPSADTERRHAFITEKFAELNHQYTEVRTVLIGISGTNGMHAEINQIRARIHGIEGDIGVNAGVGQTLKDQIVELRRRVDGIDRAIGELSHRGVGGAG